MFVYECFYKNKRMEVRALRSFDAQEIAAKAFKARKSYEVTVVLAAKLNDEGTATPVPVSTTM